MGYSNDYPSHVKTDIATITIRDIYEIVASATYLSLNYTWLTVYIPLSPSRGISSPSSVLPGSRFQLVTVVDWADSTSRSSSWTIIGQPTRKAVNIPLKNARPR